MSTWQSTERHSVPAVSGYVPDFYGLLNVDPSAGTGAVRKAIASARACLHQGGWRSLRMQLRGVSEPVLDEAEGVLTDARTRAEYDRRREDYKDRCRIPQPFW